MRKTAAIRKAEIVSVVLMLADRIGPDRVTTNAVANTIGITQGALFRHFPSKSALWMAVAENISSQLGDAWVNAASSCDDPRDRLSALIIAQLVQISTMPALPMLLFSRELNVENAELRAVFQERLATFSEMLQHEIKSAQEAGVFRRDVRAADFTILLTSLVQGLAIRWSLGARNFPLQAEGERLLGFYLDLLNEKGSKTCAAH